MKPKWTALITGATGGLGAHLSHEFAGHGYQLVLTARDPRKLRVLAKKLRESYGVRVTAIAIDLNQENAAQVLVQKLHERKITIDVLVNNAGFGLGGVFAGNRHRSQDAMIRVNLQAPTRLCRLLLPGMLQRGHGGVLNICSTGSFVPGPYQAVYCATKAYLLSLSEALAHELRHTPVQVTAVCPGAMHTGFAGRAHMEQTLLFTAGVMDARVVAKEAYHAFAVGRRVAVPGVLNRAMIMATRFLPRRVLAAASGLIQKPFEEER